LSVFSFFLLKLIIGGAINTIKNNQLELTLSPNSDANIVICFDIFYIVKTLLYVCFVQISIAASSNLWNIQTIA